MTSEQYEVTRGGGYYFNVGCSDLIVDGEVGLIQFSDIAEFVTDGVRLRDGNVLKADVVVLATGYQGRSTWDRAERPLHRDDVAGGIEVHLLRGST